MALLFANPPQDTVPLVHRYPAAAGGAFGGEHANAGDQSHSGSGNLNVRSIYRLVQRCRNGRSVARGQAFLENMRGVAGRRAGSAAHLALGRASSGRRERSKAQRSSGRKAWRMGRALQVQGQS
jgi:hypothetical protein